MGQNKKEKIKMLAKDAENATSNEFFLKDIKNKKNLHKKQWRVVAVFLVTKPSDQS